MSNRSKAKGSSYEREVEREGQAAGLACRRTIFSGALGHIYAQYIGDVDVDVQGVVKKIECKRRARGFATFYKWLRPEIFAVFFRDDHEKSMVMLRAEDFWKLINNKTAGEENGISMEGQSDSSRTPQATSC